MARWLSLLFVVLLAACGGGGDSPPVVVPGPVASAAAPASAPVVALPAQPASAPPLIYTMGDSETAGYMPYAGLRNVLKQDLAYTRELEPLGEVLGVPVGGYSTGIVADSLFWMEDRTPAIVTIMLGINDAVYSVPREVALANMVRIMDKWPSAKFVLIAPPQWRPLDDAWLGPWAQDVQRLAQARGAEFVDAYTPSLSHQEWFCHPLEFHPCQNAHRWLGAQVAAAVQKQLSH